MTFAYRFRELLFDDLLPTFCNHESRQFGVDGFSTKGLNVDDIDAENFLRAWDGGLIKHIGRGQYWAPMSGAKEQFFNSGLRCVKPRPVYLAHESIISVGVLARLHFDFGWPADCLGLQSRTWAFDVTAFQPNDRDTEFLACEVKKGQRDLDRLILAMQRFALTWVWPEKAHEINAAKKAQCLRQNETPVFWAVGPGATGHVFKVAHGDGGMALLPASENILYFQGIENGSFNAPIGA